MGDDVVNVDAVGELAQEKGYHNYDNRCLSLLAQIGNVVILQFARQRTHGQKNLIVLEH